MELCTIGSGTVVPEPEHVCSGHLVATGDLRILFDCGPGVVHGMARHGVDRSGITHVALSHFHNDHIGDLPYLFFAWKHGGPTARRAPLTLIGPAGTRRLLRRMAAVFGSHLTPTDFRLEVIELPAGSTHEPGLDTVLTCCATPHTPESLAYRLDAGGRSFCYTGDTGPDDRLAEFAQGVDVLLAECSVPDAHAMPIHLSPAALARIANAARPGTLIVTHVYPTLRPGIEQALRDAGWAGELRIASDGGCYPV